jgi:hypothetical protein
MASYTIAVDPTLAFFTQTTTLDGTPYLLTFRYNYRESVYYLDIYSADGKTPFVVGLKIVCSFPLLRTYATPPGELYALTSSTTDDTPPALGEMGDGLRVQLVYIDEATLIAADTEPWRNPGPK